MGFLLYIIAFILFIPLTILNVICVLWKHFREHGFWKTIDRYFFYGAIDIDIFGNHNFRCFLNTTMRKYNGYSFGIKGETISSALGKNQRNNTLSWFGWIWVYILWGCDYKYWKKGGHCINSINLIIK